MSASNHDVVIVGAGAAGLTASPGAGTPGMGTPTVRTLPSGGIAAALLLAGCHIIVHTRPEDGLLLLDVLAPRSGDPRKAADVFARRLSARHVHAEEHARG